MVYKIKNKTYQPIPLVIEGNTLIIPERKFIELSENQITPQIIALKSKGLLQLIKK